MDSQARPYDNAKAPFPFKLFQMLTDAHNPGGFSDIVSWDPDGKVFKVHDSEAFVKYVAPNYFKQTRYKAFQRQLCLYGFERIMKGPLKGSRYHRFFLQGREDLVKDIKYIGIKSNQVREIPIVEQSISFAGNAHCVVGSCHSIDYRQEEQHHSSYVPSHSIQVGILPSVESQHSSSNSNFISSHPALKIAQDTMSGRKFDPTEFWSDIELVPEELILGIEDTLGCLPKKIEPSRMARPVPCFDDQLAHVSARSLMEAWRKGYEHALSSS